MSSDIYTKADVKKLLEKRNVLMIGDSNMRCLYKDLIILFVENGISPVHVFRGGGLNKSFRGDRVVGISKNHAGRDFHETREFQNEGLLIRFVFVTRVYSERIKEELREVREGKQAAPQVVILNSFLWDLTRWGPLKETEYKENMVKLFKDIRRSLPDDTLVMWLTTLPVASSRVKGGVFVKQVEFVAHSMRFWILEGNKFAQQLCLAFGFNVLDLHHHMRFELHKRANDGIHWEPPAVRYLTNLLLTHIALSLNQPLPGNFRSTSLNNVKRAYAEAEKPEEILLGKDVLEMLEEIELDDDVTKKRVTKKAKRRRKSAHVKAESDVSHMEGSGNNGKHKNVANRGTTSKGSSKGNETADAIPLLKLQLSPSHEPKKKSTRNRGPGLLENPFNQLNQNYSLGSLPYINNSLINLDVFSRLQMPNATQISGNYPSTSRQGLYTNGNNYRVNYNPSLFERLYPFWKDLQPYNYSWH